MALVVGVSLLAVAPSAAPAGPDADPSPSISAGTNQPELTLIPNQGRRAAYDCPAAATACFYTGLDGTGTGYAQTGCGFEGLGGLAINENVHSTKNQRGVATWEPTS